MNRHVSGRIFGMVLFLGSTVGVQASTWEEYGFKIVTSSQDDDRMSLELLDGAGKKVTVVSSTRASDAAIPLVAKLHKQMLSWKSMQVKSERYTLFESGVIEIQVFPELFADGDVDFMKHIPGHLFFIYKDQLQYSFRLEVNKLFVKIKGYYTDEADLLKKLKQAIKDPQGFIVKRDPEYFIAKLEKLEEELEVQKGKSHSQEKELIRLRAMIVALHNSGFFSGPEAVHEKLLQRVVEIKKQNPAWGIAQITEQLDREKIEWSKKHVRLILAVFYSEYE
jgi:hypothetical protein